jgi:hypothetical protein
MALIVLAIEVAIALFLLRGVIAFGAFAIAKLTGR